MHSYKVKNINELKAQNGLINSTLQILENEKSRHLEQNIIEQENLQREIEKLSEDLDNLNKQLNIFSKDNTKLKETLNKVNYC